MSRPKLATRYQIPPTARLLSRLAGPAVKSLVDWLMANVYEYEKIDIHEWHDEMWYIIVRDTRIEKYPDSGLIGFSVDLNRDVILWVDDFTHPVFNRGGNCFVRSVRWCRKVKQQYPDITFGRDGRKGKMYDYRERRKPLCQITKI